MWHRLSVTMSKKTFEELFTELQHKAAQGDPATSRTAADDSRTGVGRTARAN